MTIGALLVARLSSSRLPAKNLLDMAGKPMIARLAERVGAAKVDKVIIATSTEPSDDPLADYAEKAGILCHRGPLDDVMARICGAGRAFGCDTLVEILGDNPLLEPGIIDAVIDLYQSKGLDYAANVSNDFSVRPADARLFPIGVRAQIYSLSTAERYVDFPEIVNDPNRHPSAFIYDQPSIFKVGFIEAAGPWAAYNRPPLNFAVNYRKNYELARALFDRLGSDPLFPLTQAFEVLDRERYLYGLFGAD